MHTYSNFSSSHKLDSLVEMLPFAINPSKILSIYIKLPWLQHLKFPGKMKLKCEQTKLTKIMCLFTKCLCCTYFPTIYTVCRGVPIIGSGTISATNMVFFTNIGTMISTEQQEDRYHYRYLCSSSLYINGLYIGFLRYPCGSGSLFTATSATLREAI